MRYVILSACVLLGCQEAQAAKKVVAVKKKAAVVRQVVRVERPVFVNHDFRRDFRFNNYGASFGYGGYRQQQVFLAPQPCGCDPAPVSLPPTYGGGGCFGGYGNGSFLLRDRFVNGRRFGFSPFFGFGGRHGGFAFGF